MLESNIDILPEQDSDNVEGAKKIVDENDTDDDIFNEILDKIDDDKNPALCSS